MDEYKTMTEIGASLGGKTSHQIGKALKALGLRTPGGWPTNEALEDEWAIEVPTDGRYRQFNWDVERVVPLLKEHFTLMDAT